MNWAEEELKSVDLGDKRRNRRLIKIVEDLANSPESSASSSKVPVGRRDHLSVITAEKTSIDGRGHKRDHET
jgi:hypothetical protein